MKVWISFLKLDLNFVIGYGPLQHRVWAMIIPLKKQTKNIFPGPNSVQLGDVFRPKQNIFVLLPMWFPWKLWIKYCVGGNHWPSAWNQFNHLPFDNNKLFSTCRKVFIPMSLFSNLSLLEVEKWRKLIFLLHSRNKRNSKMDLVVSIHRLLQFFRINRCYLLIAKCIVCLKHQF